MSKTGRRKQIREEASQQVVTKSDAKEIIRDVQRNDIQQALSIREFAGESKPSDQTKGVKQGLFERSVFSSARGSKTT